ncbi:hypothetical protein EF879_11680 [Micromonospora sp. HM5-17]|nr:hypothetical protein EF879_11680 [Micromonospora sp. HM5-17]
MATTFHTFATISARISSAIGPPSSAPRPALLPATIIQSWKRARPGRPAAGRARRARHRRGSPPAGRGTGGGPWEDCPARAGERHPRTATSNCQPPLCGREVTMAKRARKKKARKKSAANHGKRPNS